MRDHEYAMVVIDDIRAVVKGISRDVDWSEHGIQVVGTAFDGENGMALIRSTVPDIIVTDIRMPKCSGIDMIREVLALIPASKVIFISGYSDFDDVQNVLRMGAFDYILKPFTPKQLVEIVLKAKRELDAEREKHRQERDMQQLLRESMPLLRQEYLSLLMHCHATEETALARWEFLQMDMAQSPLAVMLFEIDQFARDAMHVHVNEMELLRFAVHNIVEETIRTYTTGVVFRDSVNRLAAIVNPCQAIDMLSLSDQCRGNVARYARCTVSAGVSAAMDRLVELPAAYRQAMEALTYTFYTGGNSVFEFGNIQTTNLGLELFQLSAEREKELVYAIRTGLYPKAKDVLDQIVDGWDARLQRQAPLPSPNILRTVYAELAAVIHKAVPELAKLEDRKALEDAMRILTSPGSEHRKLRLALEEVCRICCDCVQSHFHTDGQAVIHSSIGYIRDHLHLNLMVSDYANQVHLSPSYYANLFKKITGMSVMQFVTQERMDRAKLLLIAGKPIGEVARLLGYEDRSYFSDVFKRCMGITPTEFRARREAL